MLVDTLAPRLGQGWAGLGLGCAISRGGWGESMFGQNPQNMRFFWHPFQSVITNFEQLT